MEKLFRKVKNENVSFGNHKSELRDLLLSRDYFSQKSDYWDWKLVFSSLSFSCLLIAFIFISPASSGNMVSSLDKNINVNNLGSGEWAGQDVKVYEMVEQKTKTLFYFDVRNDVLVHSEVNNK
ncbi:MAG: hypothetical protein PHV29_02930 [Candidatus Pacebacteria bacterium]|nr:hypothetical protein [Candidatus Paceibacterota bacterium]